MISLCSVSGMDILDTDRLILEVRSRPSLWDSSSELYSNKDLKRRGWGELAEIFGGTDLTARQKKELGIEIQKKWKNLRDCYARDLRRQREAEAGYASSIRKKEYVFTKKLQFLRNVINLKDGYEVVELEPMEDSRNEEVLSLEYQPSPQFLHCYEETPYQKRKRFSDHNVASESDPYEETPCQKIKRSSGVNAVKESDSSLGGVLAKYIESRERQEKKEDDEDRMFLLSMLPSMKLIPQDRKLSTKIKMMTVLNESINESVSDIMNSHC